MSRRKSKWDIPADDLANSNGNSASNSAAEAAKERAAKLTAMLAAKGKLANNTGSILPVPKPVIGVQPLTKIEKDQDLITAEVEINDSPSRIILCKGTTQDEINRYSGAAVSTKGRFMDADERMQDNEGVRPLYLCIQGTSQDKVDKAVQRIQEIMAGSDIFGKQSGASQSRWSSYQPTASTPPTIPITQAVSTQAIPTGMHYVQDKVFVGLDSTCSPDFNVKEKLIGPAGSFFQHITTETGAKVFLRGKGSGFLEPTSGREAFEALHIYISHAKPEGLSAAKKLVENLIQTVNNEYQNFEQMKRAQQTGHLPQPGLPPPGYLPPMGYPPRPGMPHPPGSFPVPPGHLPPPPGGYYRHPLPAGHIQPPAVPYPVPPHGYCPPPRHGPPLPRGQSNGSAPNYTRHQNPPATPHISPFPPRPSGPSGPSVPPSIGPSKSVPSQVQDRNRSEHQNNRERPMLQDKPIPEPQPEPPRRRFKEASRSELPQEPHPRNNQESTRIPEPSPLGIKQDPRHKNTMPPPLMPQVKSQPKLPEDGFKKPLGSAKPFLVPAPPRDIIRKESVPKKPELPGNTRKHGLSKTSDESQQKKPRKEEKDTAVMSLVAYDGDSSEEEDEPTPSQPSNRSTSRNKPANLPFWAVGK